MNKVIHFELPADDLDRAKKFYQKAFGWKIKAWDENYYLVSTGSTDKEGMPLEPGRINGGMMKRKKRGESPVVVVGVASVDRAVKKAEAAGGRIVMPKMPIDKMGFYARVQDTEGNVIGLFESKRR